MNFIRNWSHMNAYDVSEYGEEEHTSSSLAEEVAALGPAAHVKQPAFP